MKTTKTHWKPGTMLYPLPAVVLSCGMNPEDFNLITVSWAGTICTDPAMVSVSIRPQRRSHTIISETQEFVINMMESKDAWAVDYCGVKSGRDTDKWAVCNFKRVDSVVIKTPQIASAPVSIECKVKQVLKLGSHDCFLAEVVNVSVRSDLVNEKGYLNLKKADLFAYVHGEYLSFGKSLGKFGFSVKKKK